MTRIAYLCADPGVPVFGTKGSSVHVQEILRAFVARGDEVQVHAARIDDHLPPDLAKIPVHHVPIHSDTVQPAAVLHATVHHEDDAEVRTVARERGQAEAASRLARQVINVDLAYERYSLFSTALAQVTQRLDIPGVLEVNAPLIDEQATHRSLVDRGGALAALRVQVGAASSVACVSEAVAGWVLHHCPDAGPRLVVAPNGVNTDRITPSTPIGDPPIVLFVGTLKPWHGVDVLLDAAAAARRRWRLRIVGDGPQRTALAVQAERLGLTVDFRGAVPPHEMPEAIAGASVAVAPYPQDVGGAGQYFSPLKIFEYAAAGLPVVASRVGQVPQIVGHGRTGLLVPPSDVDALAGVIDRLVADPIGARRMGLAGRALMERQHTWPAVLDHILAPLTMINTTRRSA